MVIAIYGSRRQSPFRYEIEKFLESLRRRDIAVLMHPKLYSHLEEIMPRALAGVRESETVPATVDLVLSIGGDGTFLRTVQWVGGRMVPILGINTGHLGFLTAATIDDLPHLLDDYLNGAYVGGERTMIEVIEPRLGSNRFALNEVAVAKDANASMITVDTAIDGVHLCDYSADGLIVSTPTGSTAYALSVGGPILTPGTPAFVLAPIAAHSLSMRSLVLGDDATVELQPRGRAHRFRLSVDGYSVSLPMGQRVLLRKADHPVVVMHKAAYSFGGVLRSKLGWE